MTMAAAGLRGQVLKAAEGDALDMAVRSRCAVAAHDLGEDARTSRPPRPTSPAFG